MAKKDKDKNIVTSNKVGGPWQGTPPDSRRKKNIKGKPK
jgi:hypothetical protein